MKIFCLGPLNLEQNFSSGVIPVFDAAGVRLRPARSHNSRLENEMSRVSFAVIKKKFPSFGVVVSRREEIEACHQWADYIYIPGEYCRQSDVLEAAAEAKKTILLERGAFLAPKELLLAKQKISQSDVWFVDAGSSFGYGDRVLDVRALDVYRLDANAPYGINLSELLEPAAARSEWAQTWTHDVRFASGLLKAAKALGISFVCCRHENLSLLD